MKEIFADFNNFDTDGTLDLACAGSVKSIAALEEPLAEGETVWFSDGELRVKGTVHRRPDGTWEGRSDWKFVG
jgi:hypothetical protein